GAEPRLHARDGGGRRREPGPELRRREEPPVGGARGIGDRVREALRGGGVAETEVDLEANGFGASGAADEVRGRRPANGALSQPDAAGGLGGNGEARDDGEERGDGDERSSG